MQEIGTIAAIYRYPVKSMAGEKLDAAELGWHGIEGDRRYAFMRTGSTSGFPWLTASKMPELITYMPCVRKGIEGARHSLWVRTPAGDELELESEALLQRLAGTFGHSVQLIKMDTGIFDDSPVSLISTSTIRMLESESGRSLDERRFRPNIVVDPGGAPGLVEDQWVARTLVLGCAPGAAAVRVNVHDIRCVMINIDPETAASDPSVLKTVARTRNKCAGVYGSTFRCGAIRAGDTVYMEEE